LPFAGTPFYLSVSQMTPEDFKNAWEREADKLITFPPEAVNSLKIPEKQRAFLINPGLPESAAPFLDFGGKHCLEIPRWADLWPSWPNFEHYRVIGFNGYGDPICVDEKSDGQIVYLNHESGMKREFINSSVNRLALSLLAFRNVIHDVQERSGPDAYLNGQIPNDIADQFIIRMDEIDPEAIKPETFWFRSIMMEGI
jgi:hypothetical protein